MKSFQINRPVFGLNGSVIARIYSPLPVGVVMVTVLWLVTDSSEYPRVEYGPYLTRDGAESAAIRLGVRFLLCYECGMANDGHTAIESVFPTESKAKSLDSIQ